MIAHRLALCPPAGRPRRWSPPWPLRAWTVGLLAFLLLRPVIGLLHELLVLGLAGLVRGLTSAPAWSALVRQVPVDPVYTLAMIRFAGEIEVRGIAVVGPIGAALHVGLPGLFAAPELAVGPWVSAIIEPGATVTARGLAQFGANLGTLLLGVGLFLLGLRRGHHWLIVCGALQQAHVVLYQFLDASLSLRDLEAAGLPFAVSTLLSDPTRRAPWFTSELASLPDGLVSLAVGLLLAGLAYLLVGALLGVALAGRWAVRRVGGAQRPALLGPPRLGAPAATFGLTILVLALTPLGAFAEAQTRLLAVETPVPGDAGATAAPGPTTGRRSGPATVDLVGGDYRYSLLVDGRPTVIRGMGYNVQYNALDPAERARRYDRDFGLLRASGVNVLFGWFPEVFGRDTLAKAQEYGLGVGMPYELNQDLDYDDPAVRARLTRDVLAWVAEYKDDPAVWFWTPGNEVIHRLIFPAWLNRTRDPAREARADSFARFYVELIDQIHALDPKHPIIYRDAEEVYLARIRDALLRDGKPRPWFFYGANVYSSRLAEIVANWPKQGLDVPLFISEFSPGGTGPSDRPRGLRAMWSTIRANPEYVLGGSVYTWTTDGPEELDRVFGLVDASGQPRDAALAAIADFYRGDPGPG